MIQPLASGDVCALLGGIDRSTLRYFRLHQGFPEPAWTVSNGTLALWDRGEVLGWRRARKHKHRTRYSDGLKLYRRQLADGNPCVADAAKVADVHPSTFRHYLRECGEPLPGEYAKQTQALSEPTQPLDDASNAEPSPAVAAVRAYLER